MICARSNSAIISFVGISPRAHIDNTPLPVGTEIASIAKMYEVTSNVPAKMKKKTDVKRSTQALRRFDQLA